MDEPERQLNNLLNELALEAKKHPKGSKDRQSSLTKLTNGILQTNPRCKSVPNLLYRVYRELKNEALQETFWLLYKNIDKYDPSKGDILHLFNKSLRFRFQDVYDEHLKRHHFQQDKKKVNISEESLNSPLFQDSSSDVTLIDMIEQPESANLCYVEWENLKRLIKNDPTGQFKSTHVKDHPEASFQVIALLRFEKKSWQDLSNTWRIDITTLSSFYRRQVKKFNPIFQQYLGDDCND
jgi:hypothetical protein